MADYRRKEASLGAGTCQKKPLQVWADGKNGVRAPGRASVATWLVADGRAGTDYALSCGRACV